jgi:protein-disulfide isomerase
MSVRIRLVASAALVVVVAAGASLLLAVRPGGSQTQKPTVSTPGPATAETFSPSQRGEIERIMKNYLIAHPEVLQDAIAELEKRQAAADAEKKEAAVKDNAKDLFESTRQVVLGNPAGDATMVEFFDYNCGYCKRAMTDMFDLLHNDPKLKIVLKEFPVLGPGSLEAAQVAVAVRMQDPQGKKYLEFHQKLLGGRGQADRARALAAAKDAGLDMARLDKDLQSEEVKTTLDENLRLAETLGISGTPTYVVGHEVVVGAVGLSALKEKVNAARCGKAQC